MSKDITPCLGQYGLRVGNVGFVTSSMGIASAAVTKTVANQNSDYKCFCLGQHISIESKHTNSKPRNFRVPKQQEEKKR